MKILLSKFCYVDKVVLEKIINLKEEKLKINEISFLSIHLKKIEQENHTEQQKKTVRTESNKTKKSKE